MQLLGLNAWAWKERSALAAKRDASRTILTQTFPQVRAIVDPPLQMEREVDALRQVTGGVSARDLEAMLGALASATPPGRSATGLEYNGTELRVRGLAGPEAQVQPLLTALRSRGYAGSVAGRRAHRATGGQAMKVPEQISQTWRGLAPREKLLAIGAAALVLLALLWWLAIGPAIAVLRTSEPQHRALDAQLARMQALQQQARTLQTQPKQGHDESLRALEAAVRQRLGTTRKNHRGGRSRDAHARRHAARRPGHLAGRGACQRARPACGSTPDPRRQRRLGRHARAHPAGTLGRKHAVRRLTASPRSDVPWRWAALGACVGVLLALLAFAPARWLTSRVAAGTGGQLLLLDPRGTVWTGSAQLVLTGGPGSSDAASLPTRVDWRLRPSFGGLRLLLSSACCTPQPLAMTVAPGLGSTRVAIADAPSRWPASILTGLGTPWNTLQLEGDLDLRTQGLKLHWAAGRLQVEGRAELTAARRGVAPVHPASDGQLPAHAHRRRRAGAATVDARRRPATHGQRPVGGLAPALHGRGQRRARPRDRAREPAEHHRPPQRRALHHHHRLTVMNFRPALLSLLAAAAVAAAGSAHAQRSREPVTLNFANADIEAVARTMAAITGRNIVVDPRVKGTMTLSTERPVPPQRAFDQFVSTLRLSGFTVVDSGGLLKVVPEADAKLQGGTVSVGSPPTGSQIVTQIFRLNYETAANLVPILRPLITPNNTINVNPGNNSLVITDYADNLQRLGRIISALDVSNSADVEVVPLKNGACLRPCAGGAAAGRRRKRTGRPPRRGRPTPPCAPRSSPSRAATA